jgi:hypothetical protein
VLTLSRGRLRTLCRLVTRCVPFVFLLIALVSGAWMAIRHPEQLSHSVLSVLATQALALATAIRAVNPNGVMFDTGDDSDVRSVPSLATALIDGRLLTQHSSRLCGLFVTTAPREDRAGMPALSAQTLVRFSSPCFFARAHSLVLCGIQSHTVAVAVAVTATAVFLVVS